MSLLDEMKWMEIKNVTLLGFTVWIFVFWIAIGSLYIFLLIKLFPQFII